MMDRKELAHAAYQIFLRDMKAIGENDLEVWKASSVATTSPRRYHNNNFQGQLMKIVALPSSEKLEVKEPEKTEAGLPGQMNLEDYLEAIHDRD